MSRSKQKRQRFFEHGKTCLDAICTAPLGVYVCPICLAPFSDPDQLSLEHVPPRSQGGKELCLTCRPCNSRAGQTIDSAVHRLSRLHRFLQSEGIAERAKLQVEGIGLNVVVHRNDRGIHIDVPKETNNPKNIAIGVPAWQRAMSNQGEITLTTSTRVRARDADIGHLKSAYLLAFAKYGYRLILQSTFDLVRMQIQESGKKHIPRFRMFFKDALQLERGLLVTQEPMSALVVFDHGAVVVLPWIGSAGGDVYAWLDRAQKEGASVRFKSRNVVPWPSTLELSLDRMALDV